MKKFLCLFLFALLASPAFAQHSVTLTWTASTDGVANPTAGYSIFRGSTSGGESSTAIATAQAAGCPTTVACSYVDSSSAVVAGATLWYDIVFVVGPTSSPASNQAEAAVPVAAATNLKATAQ